MVSIESVQAGFAERTRIDTVVEYFRLFENKLRTAFRRRVKLECHLVLMGIRGVGN